MSSYFLKGVLDDLSSIGVRYPWEKISEHRIGLLIDFGLRGGYRLWLSGIMDIGGLVMVTPLFQYLTRLFYDRASEMIS
jgi:hypothetical protein